MKRVVMLSAILSVSACASVPIVYDPPKMMIVGVPVADVRSEPKRRTLGYEYDALQETQVTQGEPVLVLEQRDGWSRIQCPQQTEFTHSQKWEGYPGWIESRFLVDQAAAEAIITPPSVFDDALRAKILEFAAQHIGQAYLWGGRSLHDASFKSTVTGVDCSGLVNLSYRRAGWLVPRDAHEQFMEARRLEPSQLKPADLIFLAKTDKPEKVVHVALIKDTSTLIEAPQSGETVREITFEKRFGVSLDQMKNGATVGDRVVYFGTFFPEKQP